MKILLDPGHGGRDPGALGAGGRLKEKHVNLEVCLYLAEELALCGLAPILTRYQDHQVELVERVALEHTHAPDLFVSIHCNAGPPTARGPEIWTSRGETPADSAATALGRALTNQLRRPLRVDTTDGDLDKEAGFYVLRKTRCPAVLVELGFITHPAEAGDLANDTHRRLLALALAQGITSWWAERAVA